eukprot:386756-Pyramimonas_sp.AAC.1
MRQSSQQRAQEASERGRAGTQLKIGSILPPATTPPHTLELLNFRILLSPEGRKLPACRVREGQWRGFRR